MATLAKIEMSGMTIKADPKFETISLKSLMNYKQQKNLTLRRIVLSDECVYDPTVLALLEKRLDIHRMFTKVGPYPQKSKNQ